VTRLTAAELERVHDARSPHLRELRAELKRIDALAAAEQFDEVAASFLELATDFHYAGLPRLVLAAIADLRLLVPPTRLAPETDAWAMNYEALGQSALGDEQRAGQILERMLARGRELEDAQIVSTALQNLGVRAFLTGDNEEAIRLGFQAYRMKRELRDEFSAAQILLNLAVAFQARDELDDAERILTEFAPLTTRVRAPGLRASLHGNLGQLQSLRGDFESAEGNFRKALRWARKAGDLSKEVIALQNLGSLEVDRGRPGRALRWYRKALRLTESSDAPPQLELIYRSMATAFHRSGRDDEAASALERAQEAATRFGDDHLRAGALADLGALRALHGQTEEARALLTEAVKILDADADAETERQIDALRNLAVLETQLRDAAGAIAHIERALALARNADRDLRSDLLEVAAQAALAASDENRAFDYLAQDAEEADALDAREGAWRRAQAATLLRDAGAVEAALPFYDAAAASGDQLGDDQLVFDARNDRATALADLERYDAATSELEALVAFATERGNRAMEQQALYNLGEVTRRRGNPSAAVRHGRAAVALARALADVKAEVESLCNLGLALADAGELAEAATNFADGERLAHRRLDAPLLEARALSGRARVMFLEGRHSEAAELYKRAAERSARVDTEHLGDLAGLLESRSAAGTAGKLEQVAQELVDVAQRSGGESEAVVAFARSARWWLVHGDHDEAASLFAVAMVLGAVAAEIDVEPAAGEPPISEEGAHSMLMPAALMVLYAEEMLEARSEAFYEQVFTTLDEQYEGIGRDLRFVLDTARDAAARTHGSESDE
jgi:tetratricopeptide (TPR) repeat protein